MGSILLGKNIEYGKLIAVNKPFAFVVRNEVADKYCGGCLKKDQTILRKMRACSKCRFEHYCDQKCQREAFQYHKRECSHISRGNPPPSEFIRLLARIVHKTRQTTKEDEDDLRWKSLDELMTHETEFRMDSVRGISIKTVVMQYIEVYNKGKPSREFLQWVALVAMKSEINSMGIGLDYDRIGIGLYLSFSTFNHCCDPVASITFKGTTACIRAVREPLSPDERVTISYCGYKGTTKQRQAHLQRQYYFMCNCHWCGNAAHDRITTSFRCSTPDCKELLTHDSTKCPTCHISTKKLIDQIDKDIAQCDVYMTLLSTDPDSDISTMITFFQSSRLHKFHHKRTELVNVLAQKLFMDKNIKLFVLVAEQVVAAAKIVYPPLLRFDLLPYRLGKVIGMLMGRHQEGIEYMKYGMQLLINRYGSDHILVAKMKEGITTVKVLKHCDHSTDGPTTVSRLDPVSLDHFTRLVFQLNS